MIIVKKVDLRKLISFQNEKILKMIFIILIIDKIEMINLIEIKIIKKMIQNMKENFNLRILK
jgi:hypothetical protein